ncbi:helix-turn-helix transcriptional regulator [Entomospira entomophila]|uniref:Helix-turn-helix transcriptional regulator n=1 Tax=Entomospira entomophila TaxID=2719988 RepID=A0A968KQL6_9SPIO|nr:helix-turn-helix transcriptional regulator [Entomospira entomophilus]NIZ39929.1 helix-turn-helix transcriptional regulator [Entomospira entomophilus]WDI35490.1 helix-turn-helix transcriptional regulator [Entomospira entomophilus]
MDTKKVGGNAKGMTQFHQLLIKNLKIYRKQRGYSQMKLAHLCSVSPNYIGEIEMGRKFPSADTMDKIIFALNLKPYQLFFSEEDISGVDQILQNHYEQAKSNVASYVAEALRIYQATGASGEQIQTDIADIMKNMELKTKSNSRDS